MTELDRPSRNGSPAAVGNSGAVARMLSTGLSRRRFLKGSAAVGVAVTTAYVVPSIMSIQSGPAYAATSPQPPSLRSNILSSGNSEGACLLTGPHEGHPAGAACREDVNDDAARGKASNSK